MLPPQRMSAKINSIRSAVIFFALLLAAAGCTPAGPRALLKGKQSLERGDYASAVAQLKTASELLATNAAVWNYYGVALQRAGQPDDAVNAYRRALELDRDLLEARQNLGSLFLEQNKPDAAKTEFTACTLRRPNDPTGWLKLGSAQLKLGEIVPAERSFSAVLTLKSSAAEGYNGLGLARIQRGRPREAAQFFTAAVQAQPDYAAAILNLATVNQQYLHDNKTALENYRAYLALTPKPANWDEVNAIVQTLEQNPAPVTAPPPTTAKVSQPTATATADTKVPPKTNAVVATRPAQPPRVQVNTKPATANALTAHPVLAAPPQAVRVAPAPQIVTTPPPTAEPPVDLPGPPPAPKPGLWQKLFGSSKPDNAAESKFTATGITPLPGSASEPNSPPAPVAPVKKPAPAVVVAPAPVNFSRYHYLSPRRPEPGDRRAANGAFTQARMAEQDAKWAEALKAYRQAAELDPGWFEAQFNSAVIAHRLRNYSAALASYEAALALQPDSVEARYSFALTLKAAGYAPDAAGELKKILAAHPGEARAHLALANLCAQSLRDPAQARQHYLKVLELDPENPQTSDIRFWLAANPG